MSEEVLEAIFVLKRTLSTATVVIRSDYSKQFIVQWDASNSYLEMQPVKVTTDYFNLKWLINQKDLSNRLARWGLSLQH